MDVSKGGVVADLPASWRVDLIALLGSAVVA